MTDSNLVQPNYIREQEAAYVAGPVTCLGMQFPNDEARRAWFSTRLAEYLRDPDFRAIEGFPIGEDEAILVLSDPPYYTACPNPFLQQIMAEWQRQRGELQRALGIADEDYHREPFAADAPSVGFSISRLSARSSHCIT